MEVLATIQAFLADASAVQPEEITPEKHLVRDLGMDSFTMLDTVISFEKEFNIRIPDRDLRLLDTVQDVVDYLTRRLEEK